MVVIGSFSWLILFLSHSIHVFCQDMIISTLVGTGSANYSGDGGASTLATLSHPLGVVVDSAGNVSIQIEYHSIHFY